MTIIARKPTGLAVGGIAISSFFFKKLFFNKKYTIFLSFFKTYTIYIQNIC